MKEGFETLEAWKVAREFRKEVLEIARTFPPEERFQLTQQIKNSARSIHANIAEGYGRYHYKETTKHCRIARGSLDETLDHLITAFDDHYITEQRLIEMRTKHLKCRQLLNGYIRFVERLLHEKKKPRGT